MRHRLMLLLAAAVSSAAYAVDAGKTSLHFEIKRFLRTQHVGKHRDFADVLGAQEALEAAYHARGYRLVRVDLPEQELDQGVVVLNVVQTTIGRVTVEGNRHFDDANVRHALPDLREGQTPDLKAISKSLKLANENPAKKTVMKMRTGAQDNEVDATLAVTTIWPQRDADKEKAAPSTKKVRG